MIQRKICMLGGFAVGKTSLVRRYVQSLFSDEYHSTIGVKIDKKVVTVGDHKVQLMLWDLAGEDRFCGIRASYLRGSAGFILVADGTRPDTLEQVISLREKAVKAAGDVPCVLALNKTDLVDQWCVSDLQSQALRAQGLEVLLTSAKTGQGVEGLFSTLAQRVAQ